MQPSQVLVCAVCCRELAVHCSPELLECEQPSLLLVAFCCTEFAVHCSPGLFRAAGHALRCIDLALVAVQKRFCRDLTYGASMDDHWAALVVRCSGVR